MIFIVLFTLIWSIFAVLGEKATVLISGFNLKSKEEKKEYDTERMSKDYRKSMIIWIVIFLVGALGSYYINQYWSVIAFVIWLIIFLKDVHLDEEKAFEKYKRK
nr:DUF3784 domain-containing protein [Clostridium gallinarum]